MIRVRMPVGRLNHLTAASGSDIVRAHRVPSDLVGDLLISEPVGRLIRRARVVKNEGLTQLRNVYPGSEFILSTDPLFRPINITTAPDGSIYIADMYHGIIQEGNWTRPGSYLRQKIEQYQLDKIISHGRIWRLRFDGVARVPATPAGPAAQATPEIPAKPALPLDLTRPRMLEETPAQLVAHLGHENGWWRDTAQQLLVLRQDKSVVPALEKLVRSSDNLLTRFHAMWTLEGLGALDAALVRDQLKDANPRMRVQAIRASESLYKAANRSFADDYRAMTKDPDPDVALQALLTANLFKLSDVQTLIGDAQAATKAKGVQEIGRQMLMRIAKESTAAAMGYTPEQQAQLKEGETVYKTLCFTCHGEDGRGAAVAGAPVTGGAGMPMMGPALAGSPRVQGHRDYVIKTLLHGMTGPLANQTFTQVMLPMGAQNDQWVATIAFVRPQQLRELRVVRHRERCRARTRGDRESKNDVDVRGDRGVGATAGAGRPVVEGHRQSQRGARCRRAHARGLDDRHSAGAGHVAAGGDAARGRDQRGTVRLRSARRQSSGPSSRHSQAGRPARVRQFSDRFSHSAVDGRERLGQTRRRGQGLTRHHRRHVSASFGKVRARHADRPRRRRTRLVGAEHADLRAERQNRRDLTVKSLSCKAQH